MVVDTFNRKGLSFVKVSELAGCDHHQEPTYFMVQGSMSVSVLQEQRPNRKNGPPVVRSSSDVLQLAPNARVASEHESHREDYGGAGSIPDLIKPWRPSESEGLRSHWRGRGLNMGRIDGLQAWHRELPKIKGCNIDPKIVGRVS